MLRKKLRSSTLRFLLLRILSDAHGVLTAEQARNLAVQALAAVKAGHDPADERKHRREAITVKELAERFDREHIAVRVKASTAKEYRRDVKRLILPALAGCGSRR